MLRDDDRDDKDDRGQVLITHHMTFWMNWTSIHNYISMLMFIDNVVVGRYQLLSAIHVPNLGS